MIKLILFGVVLKIYQP